MDRQKNIRILTDDVEGKDGSKVRTRPVVFSQNGHYVPSGHRPLLGRSPRHVLVIHHLGVVYDQCLDGSGRDYVNAMSKC
jgi:hypothetical protein